MSVVKKIIERLRVLGRLLWIIVQLLAAGVCFITLVPLWVLCRHFIPNMVIGLYDLVVGVYRDMRKPKEGSHA